MNLILELLLVSGLFWTSNRIRFLLLIIEIDENFHRTNNRTTLNYTRTILELY